jgi:predicted DNA-binding protein (UPF0251 family)
MAQYPKGTISAEVEARLDAWARLRDEGLNIPQAAAVIGCTRAALDRTLLRARRAGDDRGQTKPRALDHDAILEDWDIIWSHDTFEGCARRIGIHPQTLKLIITEAAKTGDPRATHPFTYDHRRSA